MKIGVIMIHYGQLATTKQSLTNLKNKLGNNLLVLINNTPQDIQELAAIIPGTILINNPTNLGFAKSVNQGITRLCQNPNITHFFLVNNDLTITHGSFDQLTTSFNKLPNAGIVSPLLHHAGGYDWGGTYNKWTGMVTHRNWENKPKTIQSVDHVAGAAMIISRKLVDKIGLFDERFFLYFEDLDYCLRAKQSQFTIHINPDVIAEHQVSAGSSLVKRILHQWRSHILFMIKYLPLKVFPTAIIFDSIFYPLVTFKIILSSLLRLKL